jgi:hypothetical protein
MILRAAFWIAIVWFFMPREPDLGFGRPDNGSIGGLLQTVESQAQDQATCSVCVAGTAVLDRFQGVAVHSLDEVKADIEASRRKHAAYN